MFGPLLFVAGILGGLVSLAFLLGVLIVEPLAFFIVIGLAFLCWQLAGRPWTGRRGEAAAPWITTLEAPVYEDDEDF